MKTSETAKITKTLIDNARPLEIDGRLRQKVYFDTELKGFGICIGKKAKTFFAQKEVKGKVCRVTIGRYGVFTVQQARKEAQQYLARMAKGENINETKRREKARGITLGEAFTLYIDTLHTKGRSTKTIKSYIYSINTYLDDWVDRPLASISRKEARSRHYKISRDVAKGRYSKGRSRNKGDGRYTANGVMRVFRAVYNRALKQHEDLPPNPCINIDWYPESRRDAAIPSEKLHLWYSDVMALDNPIRRDYLRFVLFTGLRRQNAAEIKWEHIDLRHKILHIPKPKSGRAFDLPLTDFLEVLLHQRHSENPEFFPGSPWVFPAKSRTGHISEPKVKLTIPWTVHGLRNTFITVAEQLNISPYSIKMLVNHSVPSRDVTGGYIKHEVERLRDPMQQITTRLLNLCT